METLDMAEAVETFSRKFMEGAAGTAGRVAGVCAGLVANPGGMAPHDMELELARLVGAVPNSLSARWVTEASTRSTTQCWPPPASICCERTLHQLSPVPPWSLQESKDTYKLIRYLTA